MKSKKLSSLILTFTIVIALVACSNKTDSPKFLTKEENSQIISFHAPKEAITLNVNVYRLEGGENWSSIGGGAISI